MTKRFLTAVCIQFMLTLIAPDAGAVDIVVVNNNDTGTGSLRWSLEQAAVNGSLTPDRIIFAIPSTAGADRLISVASPLPNLSSNLMIDGSMQAGAAFGMTDAKIGIWCLFDVQQRTGVMHGSELQDLQIYGISFTGAFPTGMPALVLDACKNVIIGIPGKGNHFDGLGIEMSPKSVGGLDSPCENVKISANIFGLSPDGETATGATVRLNMIRNITIGGTTAAEGNHVIGIVAFDDDPAGNVDISNGKVYIGNNKLGLNLAGIKVPDFGGGGSIRFWGSNADEIEIVDNQMAGSSELFIAMSSSPFKIARNKFGTDATGTQILGVDQYAIRLENLTGRGIIGGPDPADGNVISGTYSQPGDLEGNLSSVSNFECPNVEVVNNIFRCNRVPRAYGSTLPNSTPTITGRDAAGVRGKAQPNSRVDLYYSLSCTFCEPEQLFASVPADGNGDWAYTGAVQDLGIIAAATLNGRTSGFSSPYFDYLGVEIVIKPACSDVKGSIKGLKAANATSYGWYDEHGTLVSTDFDLVADPGKYQFRIVGEKCVLNSPVYEIPGVIITLDLHAKEITPQSCGALNGAIRGIQSNASSFIWYDKENHQVGADRYLERVAAGSYTLLASLGDCDKVFGPFEIPALEGIVTINNGSASTSAASCQKANGSITGMLVNGADKYEWIGENGEVYRVTPGPDLPDAPAGRYRLRASSATCSQLSDEFTITEPLPVSFANVIFSMIQPCADKKGSISVDLGGVAAQIQVMEWRNDAGELLGSAATLSQLNAGIYLLYLTDINGCRNLFRSFDLQETIPMAINESGKTETDDQCGYGHGSITGLAVSGGSGQRSYIWRNAAGEEVGTDLDLLNVSKGSYTFEVSDDSQCNSITGPFLVGNNEEPLAPPILSDIGICAAGEAIIAVQHAVPGMYSLYHDALAGSPIAQNNSGVFKVVAGDETAFYVSVSNGTCESTRTKVLVKIENPNLKISNAFSPNGDGKNDTWKVSDLDNYPKCQVSVYNREGTAVYHSTGYKTAFEGKFKGADLPVGVYYYVIRLRQGCTEISGSLTIIR